MFFYATNISQPQSAFFLGYSDGKINRIVSSYLVQYSEDGWNSAKVIKLSSDTVTAETKELKVLY
jgi:hypothetical protein